MELRPLREIAQSLDLEPGQAITKLKEHGLEVTNDFQVFKDIAESNGLSPRNLYAILSGTSDANPIRRGSPRGRGMGRKTLRQVATEMDQSPEALIDHLRAQGIAAKPEDRMRDIASRAEITPVDLVQLLEQIQKK
jgi:hypothetical protein